MEGVLSKGVLSGNGLCLEGVMYGGGFVQGGFVRRGFCPAPFVQLYPQIPVVLLPGIIDVWNGKLRQTGGKEQGFQGVEPCGEGRDGGRAGVPVVDHPLDGVCTNTHQTGTGIGSWQLWSLVSLGMFRQALGEGRVRAL